MIGLLKISINFSILLKHIMPKTGLFVWFGFVLPKHFAMHIKLDFIL